MTRTAKFTFLVVLLSSLDAAAGWDTPGSMRFDLVWEPDRVISNWLDLPAESTELNAEAYFSSDASQFGEQGVLMWAGFNFTVDGAPRYGILLLDIDLTRAPIDGETPVPAGALRAEYLEKWQDQIFFSGELLLGDVWIVDIFFHEDDAGALEGDLALIFADPSNTYPGSRALLRGRFATYPAPSSQRRAAGLTDSNPNSTVHVSSSCSGDVYVADDPGDGCDCGGDDPETSGCEGDTSADSSSVCEAGGSGGCEGDAGSSGCEGDSGSGSCDAGGSSDCATASRPRNAPAVLLGLQRFFPEFIIIGFILFLKRRLRP